MIHDIVIPTYKRKEKLVRCLKSLPFNSNKIAFNLFLYFDNNDVDTYKEFGVFRCQLFPVQFRAFGAWNYHLKDLQSQGMVYLCDDTELLPDCLENLYKEFESRFPDTDGVVTFNQSNIKGSDSAMGLIGRKFAERYPNKQCFCPDYVSFFADSEIGDYAKKLGKFYYCEEAKLIHYHPAFYKNEVDEAHRIVRDSNQGIDKKVNAERKRRGLLWGESLTLIRGEIK